MILLRLLKGADDAGKKILRHPKQDSEHSAV
jgi:hypothetical protein